MSKSNYSSQHSTSHSHHRSSQRSPSRSHRPSSRSERSTSALQGSTSRVDKLHRLHVHDSIYSLDPSCTPSSQYSTTNGNEVKQHLRYASTKTINKSNQNSPPHEKYSTFHVHSSDYEVVFVNNKTSTNTMNKLLNHVNTCKQYSIDTESERANNQLSLIQINSIPIKPPSLVMLFELKHFPDRNSQKYENIYQLLQLIFRLNNEIYSWGNMQLELGPVKELFIWPIPAELIDIQPHFPAWYNWARTQCGVQGLSHRNDKDNDNDIIQQHHQQLSCHCHPPSPYKINELWSLQNAFMYGFNLFIDKSCRLSHWSSSLSSSNSSLAHVDRMKMIHYAAHDAMAVTFLIRPITEKWTFNKIKNRKMNEMFVAFNSTKLPPLPTSKKKEIKNINMQKLATLFRCNDPDVEEISSDDEIYLNQLIKPNDLINKHDDIINGNDEISLLQDQIEPIDIDYTPVINDGEPTELIQQQEPEQVENEPLQIQHQSNRRRRSSQSKKHKNKKRNVHRRKYRYRHSIIRRVYIQFPMYLIRKILRLYNIGYTHVRKNEENDLVIGLKDRRSKHEAEHNLSMNIFSKRSYLYYIKLYRR